MPLLNSFFQAAEAEGRYLQGGTFAAETPDPGIYDQLELLQSSKEPGTPLKVGIHGERDPYVRTLVSATAH